MAFLTQAAERIDERLLTLLTALGPKVVAADPGLPLRLLTQVPRLPRLTVPQRQLLSLRLAPLDSGPAQGGGVGWDRSGLAHHGPLTALVPSQLVYPRRLLRWRFLNGGLLYRTRTGREPPQLRPTVIVLDTSPACWGPIESLTRPAAYALADSLARQGMPAVLLSAGDNQVHLLTHPAERLVLLTHRSRRTADPVAVLTKAQALLNNLAGGPTEPIILLLTHCHWGTEGESFSAIPRLRGLFVQYPKREVRPPWAERCERWESLRPTELSAVARALGRLIG